MEVEAKWQEMYVHESLESGEEIRLPMAYWAKIDDPDTPYIIELNVQVRLGGEHFCSSFEASQRPGGEPVTPEGLRSVQFSKLLSASLGRVMHKVVREADGSSRIIPPEEHGEWRRLKTRRRRRLTSAFLQDVARVYREAFEAGESPVQRVMQEFYGSRSSAARWVQAARSRGFLGPTEQRKAGI